MCACVCVCNYIVIIMEKVLSACSVGFWCTYLMPRPPSSSLALPCISTVCTGNLVPTCHCSYWLSETWSGKVSGNIKFMTKFTKEDLQSHHIHQDSMRFSRRRLEVPSRNAALWGSHIVLRFPCSPRARVYRRVSPPQFCYRALQSFLEDSGRDSHAEEPQGTTLVAIENPNWERAMKHPSSSSNFQFTSQFGGNTRANQGIINNSREATNSSVISERREGASPLYGSMLILQ